MITEKQEERINTAFKVVLIGLLMIYLVLVSI